MKKALSVTLGILIMLLPTFTALIFCLLPEGTVFSPSDRTGGSLTIDNGESYSFDEENNSFLTDFFKDLSANSSKSEKSRDDIQFEKEFSAKIISDRQEKSISLYFSLYGDCFWSDGHELYLINESYADTFINSKYAKTLYEFSSLPTLMTASEDTVYPMSAQWKYTLKNGNLSDGYKKEIANGTYTYYSTSITNISFSVTPDSCTVKAYVDDLKVYDGSLEDLPFSKLESEPIVKYEITASWASSSDSAYFGEAIYSFCVQQTKAAVFSVDKTYLSAGEFITVSAENITDISKLSCSFSTSINFTPRFFKSGNNAYALIPFELGLQAGVYELTLKYGETQTKFEITLYEHVPKEQYDDSDIYTKLSDAALSQMNSLISSVGSDCSDTLYAAGGFYNYENDFNSDYYIRLGFANIRTFSDGRSFTLNGVDIYRPIGENILAFNNGIVCAVGEDTLLGKYVVIEHGYGVKSWYCQVGEITVSVGRSVIKGETVARTGTSGFTSSSGFYLITTIFDKPVSPYNFYENDFVLPK